MGFSFSNDFNMARDVDVDDVRYFIKHHAQHTSLLLFANFPIFNLAIVIILIINYGSRDVEKIV